MCRVCVIYVGVWVWSICHCVDRCRDVSMDYMPLCTYMSVYQYGIYTYVWIDVGI